MQLLGCFGIIFVIFCIMAAIMVGAVYFFLGALYLAFKLIMVCAVIGGVLIVSGVLIAIGKSLTR